VTRRYGLRGRPVGADGAPACPGGWGHVGRGRRGNNRLFVEAVLYRYRGGDRLAGLAGAFSGGGRACISASGRWARKRGLGSESSWALSADADNEYAMIDATIVRAHQHSAGGAKKRGRRRGHRAASRGRLEHERSTRRRDALGNPTGFHLTGGQASDLAGGGTRCCRGSRPATVIADKGYDAEARVLAPLREGGQRDAVIPPKRNPHGAARVRTATCTRHAT